MGGWAVSYYGLCMYELVESLHGFVLEWSCDVLISILQSMREFPRFSDLLFGRAFFCMGEYDMCHFSAPSLPFFASFSPSLSLPVREKHEAAYLSQHVYRICFSSRALVSLDVVAAAICCRLLYL